MRGADDVPVAGHCRSAALRQKPLHHPRQALELELVPIESGDTLHSSVAHGGIPSRPERQLAERASGALAEIHPGEHAGPGSEVVQRREALTFEETSELEAIVEAKMWCDLLGRPDGATTQEDCLDHRSGTERQVGSRDVNGPHDRRQSHDDQNVRVLPYSGSSVHGPQGRRAVCSKRHMRAPSAWRSLLLAGAIASCGRTISTFSPIAYEQATSLKVDALALMDQATALYADHRAETESLTVRLAKAYEFAKGRPKNDISAEQWRILIDPERHLLGGFLARWKRESRLSATFISAAKGLVSDGFDTIIGLESGKVKPEQVR